MKRIGFCINSLEMGGAEKLLVDIINALYELNKFEIYLLTKEKSNSYFYNKIKNKIQYFYLIEKEEKKNIFFKLKNSIYKKINFKKFSSQVDILIDFLDGDFCKYIKKVKNKEKIIWLHSDYKVLQRNKQIENKIKNYNKIIVISDDMEASISLKNKKIYKIHNFIDYENIENRLKEQIPFEKKDNNYFLTVCRLNEEHKDIETLLKAFASYKGTEKLIIIGDGKDRKFLEKFCINNKIENRVIFLGTITNPYIFMKNSKAFILSSKLEGFGLVIAEALYCGTKVIASNCPVGPREILLDGKIGELFEVGNEKELLNKLNIISDVEYDEELIKKALKRYTKEIFIKRFKEVIEC